MSDNTTDWTKLREFGGVDIAQSFALSWHVDSAALMLDLDLYLNQDHPFYEEPRPAEKACYRAAFLEFPDCSRVTIAQSVDEQSIEDSVARLAPGKISGLMRSGDGEYKIRGEFGTVLILSDRPLLRIKDLSA